MVHLIDYVQLLLLGAVAGLTIFLGLPVAVLKVSKKMKDALNATAIGILIFILFDVLSYAWEKTSNTFVAPTMGEAFSLLCLMFCGLAIGLIGLTAYQQKMMAPVKGSDTISAKEVKSEMNPARVSLMIAIGIGVHNLSEGLAIGQSFANGELSLALILIIGFGLHNATEGFGIAAPMTGASQQPSIKDLLKLGLIGGGPTFLGTLIGSFWVSEYLYVFFLSLAAGALVYVIFIMYNSISKNKNTVLVMSCIYGGLTLGFLTDLIISLAGA